jgi:hypothetical protein
LAGRTLTGGRLNVNAALLALGDPGDYYEFDVTAGDSLLIQTATPGIGNALDPQIELYDSSDVLVGSDDNSADGTNAQLAHTATQDGRYRVVVKSSNGSGEYLLRVTGNTGVAQRPSVIKTSPADGEMVYQPPAEMTVTFS